MTYSSSVFTEATPPSGVSTKKTTSSSGYFETKISSSSAEIDKKPVHSSTFSPASTPSASPHTETGDKGLNVTPSTSPGVNTDGTEQLAVEGQTDELDGLSACFPASATATLKSGLPVRMEELRVGDVVHTGSGGFSTIFLFTHAEQAITTYFLNLTTASGHSLTLSGGHFLYIGGTPAAANSARVGDKLTLWNGTQSAVVSISRSEHVGLYNPQTLSGDVCINGIQASTFTTAVGPEFAHAVLAPVRVAFKMGIPTKIVSLTRGGGRWLAKLKAPTFGAPR